ncbi:hypothetical protein [Pelobacter propionicus]|uniref:Uncharacterized protein n=1 Tax=Pelobacter propionicus (strain DSM 2379 / NBRC 103807 / OttBd1) TaxID=338966 RepID=A1ARD2_PELPD|nr:hypothetical protein [Pelobacter propionicus]ABK99902.1 hypothetical protein Ppro_2295 [Pelobacter propionicus DSM 2379]
MTRTAEETARILIKLFHLSFDQDYDEPYRLTWPQLRSLAAVPRLSDAFLKEVNTELSEYGRTLIVLNNSLLIARENDLDHYRFVPDRILEEFLPNGNESADNDDQDEPEDVDI